MADLATEYLGLRLPSPLVLASSALSNRVEVLEMAEGHGAGAVVLRSLFEEQIEAADSVLQEELARGSESSPEARTYFPPQRVGPHEYLSLVERAKRAAIDLLVLGTHGRTGLEHALMGSVAERVVRKARCPVLTVRPPG